MHTLSGDVALNCPSVNGKACHCHQRMWETHGFLYQKYAGETTGSKRAFGNGIGEGGDKALLALCQNACSESKRPVATLQPKVRVLYISNYQSIASNVLISRGEGCLRPCSQNYLSHKEDKLC